MKQYNGSIGRIAAALCLLAAACGGDTNGATDDGGLDGSAYDGEADTGVGADAGDGGAWED
ncbi:MAG: hypothetical protein ABI333_04915, partial [bacterium]